MAVAVVIDVPHGNQQFYDRIIPTLFPNGELPEGWLMHVAGPTPVTVHPYHLGGFTRR